MQSFEYSNVTIRNEAVWTENAILQFSGLGLMSSKIATEYDNNTKQIKAIRLRDLLNRGIDF